MSAKGELMCQDLFISFFPVISIPHQFVSYPLFFLVSVYMHTYFMHDSQYLYFVYILLNFENSLAYEKAVLYMPFCNMCTSMYVSYYMEFRVSTFDV